MNDKLRSLRDSVEYAEEKLVARAQSLLQQLLNEKGMTKTDLAKKMGVSKARVSQIFSDEQNFTFRLMATAFHALGEELYLDRASKRVEFKSAELQSDAQGNLRQIGEITHGFEWPDEKIVQGWQPIPSQPFDRKVLGDLLADAMHAALIRDESAAARRRKEVDAGGTDAWLSAAGPNVIPMHRKRAVGNG